MGAGRGVGVVARRRRVTGRGVGVEARLVSRMPNDGRAVAEAEAEGLAPVGASESAARRPGRGDQGGGRGAASG
jgi:hypothetical protein